MRNVQIEKWEKENEKGNVDGIVFCSFFCMTWCLDIMKIYLFEYFQTFWGGKVIVDGEKVIFGFDLKYFCWYWFNMKFLVFGVNENLILWFVI